MHFMHHIKQQTERQYRTTEQIFPENAQHVFAFMKIK